MRTVARDGHVFGMPLLLIQNAHEPRTEVSVRRNGDDSPDPGELFPGVLCPGFQFRHLPVQSGVYGAVAPRADPPPSPLLFEVGQVGRAGVLRVPALLRALVLQLGPQAVVGPVAQEYLDTAVVDGW